MDISIMDVFFNYGNYQMKDQQHYDIINASYWCRLP